MLPAGNANVIINPLTSPATSPNVVCSRRRPAEEVVRRAMFHQARSRVWLRVSA
ncbi:hypothetical protein [Nonomuraea insulae]|uniref:Uncharacterized protein n=1 Tax=Nonomuraea insulae TaxID=1616787 RepID=A0ABW1CZN7_9ACTN